MSRNTTASISAKLYESTGSIRAQPVASPMCLACSSAAARRSPLVLPDGVRDIAQRLAQAGGFRVPPLHHVPETHGPSAPNRLWDGIHRGDEPSQQRADRSVRSAVEAATAHQLEIRSERCARRWCGHTMSHRRFWKKYRMFDAEFVTAVPINSRRESRGPTRWRHHTPPEPALQIRWTFRSRSRYESNRRQQRTTRPSCGP